MENDEKVSIGTVVLYIDSSTCHNKYLPDDFHHFVTSDKFCAETELGNTNLDSDRGVESIDFTVIGSCCFCLWLNDNFTLYAYNVDIQ